MARVWVRREALITGDLPPVCVVTGRPSDALARVRLTWLPDWTFLLLLAGVFPFLIALAFAGHRTDALVPVEAAIVRRFRRRRFVALGTGLAGLGLLVLGTTLIESLGLVQVGLGVAIVGAVANLLWARSLVGGGEPDRAGIAVRLTRVHRVFADAVGAQQPVA